MKKKMKPRIIAVEGFDGAGKTTLSKYINDFFDYEYHKSPTGVFANVRNEFDKNEVSLTERLPFYIGDCIRVSLMISELENQKFVLDRYYFSTIVYHESKQKGITKSLINVFKELYQPDLVFLIKTDFNILKKRIDLREEKSLNDELFLKEDLYNSIYELFTNCIKTDVYVIDNNGTLEDSKKQISNVLKNLYNCE